MGIPIASIIGGPVSGFILDHATWRWLFILEGLPAILCAPLTYVVLSDRPVVVHDDRNWGAALTEPRVWHLAAIGFGHGFATYAFNFWLPQLLKSAIGGSNTRIGFAVMIPNLLSLIAMIVVSRHADRTAERRWHLVATGALAGSAMMLLDARHSPVVTLVLVSAVAIGAYSFLPVFFALPGEFLTGYRAAAGIALITSVANLGGFVGPYTVGLARHGYIAAGAFYLTSAILASCISWATQIENTSALFGKPQSSRS
jgi:MFS transporter, ACS family, tartrate transporter